MDVDIALGDIDLTQQHFRNNPAGHVPLMGSLLRDRSDPMIPRHRYLKRSRQQPCFLNRAKRAIWTRP
ncbi:hypothetical protein [Corallococcus exiguus]|uniref:hypothetical protein n=1 Tax=Corallococcus exiguus TaxID=83462 RepID=UPI001A8F5F85|nr:hypothetical protein [Corallococcus exiguus]